MSVTDKQRWIEMAAVAATGLMKFVFVDWLALQSLYISAALLFWLTYILARYRKNKLILKHWGFRKANFWRTSLFVAPFALVALTGIFWTGLLKGTVFFNWQIGVVLLVYPLWGIVQQYLMLAVFAKNLTDISMLGFSKAQAILLTSLLFAIVHYPGPLLMGFTFIMELWFASAYFKYKNLWALGCFHGVIASLLLYYILERHLWADLWKLF